MSVVGKYEMLTSENFDEYLKAAGVNIAKRALAAAAKPKLLITEADGLYTLKTMSTFKDTSITFKLGEEFDEETADGRSSKTIITLDGNKLIQIQRIAPDEATTTREFNDGGMTATFTTKGVTAVRTYKRPHIDRCSDLLDLASGYEVVVRIAKTLHSTHTRTN